MRRFPARVRPHEIAEVLTSRGVSRVMLFSTAIIEAEWEANAPLREAMAIKRERLRAMRAKRAAERAGKQRSHWLSANKPVRSRYRREFVAWPEQVSFFLGDDGNRQMVDILTAVLTDGLPAVEAACAEAFANGVHSADVVLGTFCAS